MYLRILTPPAAGIVAPILLAASCGSAPVAPEELDATILYTGDLHAAIQPDPDGRGGASRRARAIEALRAEGNAPFFLLDGGGFAAGGPYDPEPQGRARDVERTLAIAAIMAATGYDAVAIGDEELASGLVDTLASFLPLTSANLPRMSASTPRVPALRRIERGGVRLNVVALTSDEPLYEGVLTPGDPITAARDALQDAPRADWTIVLSHLGEERSIELAKSVGKIDLILNAHRRQGTLPAFMAGEIPIVQFDYLGRSLIRVDLKRGARPRVRPIPIEREPAAPAIGEERIESMGPGSLPRPPIDIYMSLGCPHCEEAAESLRLIGDNILWNFELWARLQAPHSGPYSPEERFLGCARDELEPVDWLALFLSISRGEPHESSAERLALSHCLGADESFLVVDRERTLRLGIDETPALFVANRLHEGAVDPLTLEWLLCAGLPGGELSCEGAPECLSDLHCTKRGMIGTCVGRGTREAHCSRVDAPELPAVLVHDSTAVSEMEDRLLDVVATALPGLAPRRIERRRPRGRGWISRLGIRHLPALVLESDPGEPLDAAFTREGAHWVLDPEISGANLDLTRERVPRRLDIFVPLLDRLARSILLEAIEAALFTRADVDLRLFPLLPREVPADAEQRAAWGELLVVGERAPNEWLRYLTDEKLEIDGRYVSDLARDEPSEKALKELARLLDDLEVERDHLLFLAENREIVDIHNGLELVELLIRLEGAR
ncbi:MAG: hypothetical protein CME06_01320 [Gemmatimonadetes bacterium]|nr:hypothetical protein [Gemmatimonadota bacterium]